MYRAQGSVYAQGRTMDLSDSSEQYCTKLLQISSETIHPDMVLGVRCQLTPHTALVAIDNVRIGYKIGCLF